MFRNFIGVNEKFINLNTVALIRGQKRRGHGRRRRRYNLARSAGEIELSGTDAHILFDRVELFSKATEEQSQTQLVGGAFKSKIKKF